MGQGNVLTRVCLSTRGSTFWGVCPLRGDLLSEGDPPSEEGLPSEGGLHGGGSAWRPPAEICGDTGHTAVGMPPTGMCSCWVTNQVTIVTTNTNTSSIFRHIALPSYSYFLKQLMTVLQIFIIYQHKLWRNTRLITITLVKLCGKSFFFIFKIWTPIGKCKTNGFVCCNFWLKLDL